MDTPEQETAKAAAIAFMTALGDPNLTDRDAAWQGVQALFAAWKVPGLITDPTKLIERLKKISA